ncbi:MAG: flagellar basal-body rod protein FlgG [Planctomycetales bacterium]|jgi:flagellar basal-body rod protein FlgG|nr:flagellar basal-body rod protein FlgG [Planctomycetales bacterium]MBN8626577.1 flagellar basal-body rod protein FlgG [Planctomycetota bacterium]
MSVQSLYTAATGMQAMETKLDVVANNLANINTTAYKKTRANFEDLFYRQIKLPGAQDAQGNFTPTGIAVGLGTRVQSTQTDFSQGAFQTTNNQLDVAVVGRGFFMVQDPTSGQNVYTREGNFSLNAQGVLVLGSAQTGRIVQPQINIPQDALDIVISADGNVSYNQVGNPQFQQAGQLQLATFINPEGLLKQGEGIYTETQASGAANLLNPGQQGAGTLQQNALESSNVEPVRELIDLITTQRSFELNSQAVQAGDQILQLVANLRRF